MQIGRRRGRILAFQALCAWGAGFSALDELLTFSWLSERDDTKASSTEKNSGGNRTDERTQDGQDFPFPKMLVLGTIENIENIDKIISENLENWTIERLNSVDKAILRLSAYSLLYQKDIPPAVVIDEAINLAREFGTDDSYKFVNAVLDSIKKSA